MYRRHLLQKQVEEFARLMERLENTHSHNQYVLAMQIMEDAYKVFLKQDSSVFKQDLNLPPDKLQELYTFKNEQMEFLARLFFEEAVKFNAGNRFAEASLGILQYLNLQQRIYSFEREELILKIEKFLSEA